MKLDELIEKLTEIRKTTPGETIVELLVGESETYEVADVTYDGGGENFPPAVVIYTKEW